MEPPDWRQLAAFARLGVPAGLAVLVEVTSFTLMALFIARLGTLAAAAHQIASNLTAWPTWCRCRSPSPPARG